MRDQAGFHIREGDPRLSDLVKDELGNRTFATIEALREALHPILRRWWEDSLRVLDLVGRPWLSVEANASSKI